MRLQSVPSSLVAPFARPTRWPVLPLLAALLLWALLPTAARAQKKADKDPNYLFTPKKHAVALGLHLHNRGMGFDVRYTRALTDRWDLTVTESLESFKDPHENRIESLYRDQGGKNFLFGKLNYAYVNTISVGIERLVVPRTPSSRLSLSVGVSLGWNLALLKPYYLEIAKPINPTQAVIVVEAYDPSRHVYEDIVGEADFFKGMDQISAQSGARLQVYGHLNLAGSNLYVRALQVGARLDAYGQQLPLTAVNRNANLFLTGYVALLIGNAW